MFLVPQYGQKTPVSKVSLSIGLGSEGNDFIALFEPTITPTIKRITIAAIERKETLSSRSSSSIKIPTSPSPPHVGQAVRNRVAGSSPVPPHRGHVLCCPNKPQANGTRDKDNNRRKTMMEKTVAFLIMHSSLPQLFSPTPEKVLHTIKSEKTWLLPLLKDPEKNRVSICSICSRGDETYRKIGKDLDDLENREQNEQLSKLRETAETEEEITRKLEDPKKNQRAIFSRFSRDTEAYVKIRKNLEDVENRETLEKLKRYREEAEAEGIPNLNSPHCTFCFYNRNGYLISVGFRKLER